MYNLILIRVTENDEQTSLSEAFWTCWVYSEPEEEKKNRKKTKTSETGYNKFKQKSVNMPKQIVEN